MKREVLAHEKRYQHADKFMLFINIGLFIYAIGLAFWYNTFVEVFTIGGATLIALFTIYFTSKGRALSRACMATGFMVFCALHIHQAHGMVEMHFGIFALLAMLLYYRDWLPIAVAAVVIATHHILFFSLQTNGSNVWILSSGNTTFWVIILHALYVVAESGLLIWFAIKLKKDAIQSQEIMDITNLISVDSSIDLTLRTSASSPVLRQFDSYIETIDTLASEVNKTAAQLNKEGIKLAGVTDEMKVTSSEQQRETDLIAKSVDNMKAVVHEVSNQASMAAESSNKAETNASEATKISITTGQAVEILAEQVSDAVITIENLNQQTESIGTVLDVIRGVAEQTNLLALNAAIEAARAGDQGRGFAVVADEVRTLAQRTQQSTQEIDQMIESLQMGSKSAVDVIDKSREKAVNCVENTRRSIQLMEHVSDIVKDINQMNEVIATAANEQNQVVDEISKNVSNILESSTRAAKDTESSANSAQLLHRISEDLTNISSKFNTSHN